MGINAALPLLLSHPATCAVEPTPPRITRKLSGPALTGPVVVGVNETISIWCSASGRARNRQELSGLFWRYGNGTRLPVIASGESTDVHLSVPVAAQVLGGPFFTSKESSLLQLGTIRVLPITARP